MTQCKIVDVIRYNEGYLTIVSFEAKGTTWYAPVPCTRDQISANLDGQATLKLSPNSNSASSSASLDLGTAIVGGLILIGLLIVFWKQALILLGGWIFLMSIAQGAK